MSSSSGSMLSGMSSPRTPEDVEKCVRRLKEILGCPLCLETFTKPVKILPCLHSFCRDCVQHVLSPSVSHDHENDAGNRPTCPVCRTELCVDFGNADSLKDNTFFHSQLDLLERLKENDLEENGVEDESEERTKRAPLFSPESFDHTQANREDARRLVFEAKTRQRDIQQSLSEINEAEERVCEKTAKELEKIRQTFSTLERTLRERMDTLESRLRKTSEYKLLKLSQQRKQLERDFESLLNSCTFSQSLIDNASDDQFSSHQQQIETHLKKLCDDPSFTRGPNETDRFLISVDEKQVEDIQKTLSSLGQLVDVQQPRRFCRTDSKEITISALSVCKIDGTKRLVACDQWKNKVCFLSDPKEKPTNDTFEVENLLSLDFSPRDIAFYNPKEALIVCDANSGKVHTINFRGDPALSFGEEGVGDGQFLRPEGVAVDENNGNIIVAERFNHRVQLLRMDGTHIKTVGKRGSADSEFLRPHGVAVDHRNGNIIVCDSLNSRIQVLDVNGDHLRSFGSKGSGEGDLNLPRGVVVDRRNGNIIVSDVTNHRIQIFDENGSHIRCFGVKGNGPGEFNRPFSIALDCETFELVVSDLENHSVQFFDVSH